jgi:L-ascorbate metabolism protein UlaG (beta-lactamase superfamily)
MLKAIMILLTFLFISGSFTVKADDISDVFASSLGEKDVALMFLSYSGVIVRTSKGTVIIDPADLLKDKELNVLKEKKIDLVLFTHGHGDHYNPDSTLDLLEATDAPILAEPSVANSLKEAVPSDKLTSAVPGKTYTIGGITVSAVKGIHVGPINLYHIKMGDISIFHGGDSGYVSLKDYAADLAFLPTGMPSPSASPQKAFQMAEDLNPSVIVAIHGAASQSRELEDKVKKTMPETIVIIPEAFTTKVITLNQ